MMGGLAYMTGLPDRPLRAGSSVIDIMGGTFAAVGILAALRERETTGTRQARHQRALREHRATSSPSTWRKYEITGEAPPPMSVKRPAWGVYDIFDTADGGRLFVGVVTDTQWEVFCREFGAAELAADPRLKTNGTRVKERELAAAAAAGDPQALQQGRACGKARGDRPALRADRPALGPARRPAPQRRRPARDEGSARHDVQGAGTAARARRRAPRPERTSRPWCRRTRASCWLRSATRARASMR